VKYSDISKSFSLIVTPHAFEVGYVPIIECSRTFYVLVEAVIYNELDAILNMIVCDQVLLIFKSNLIKYKKGFFS
jgi:hypothetical protein